MSEAEEQRIRMRKLAEPPTKPRALGWQTIANDPEMPEELRVIARMQLREKAERGEA